MLGVSADVLLLLFLYFVQGLPYGLQAQYLPVYLRAEGLSLTAIALLKVLYVPWVLKCLWGPLVDGWGTRRRWLLASVCALGGLCVGGALLPAGTPPLAPLASLLLLLNLAASLQDVAVDSIAIGLLSAEDLGQGNTAQVVGYKLGSIFAGGVLGSFINATSSLSTHFLPPAPSPSPPRGGTAGGAGWGAQFLTLALLYAEAAIFVYVSPSLRRLEGDQLRMRARQGRQGGHKEYEGEVFDGRQGEDGEEEMWGGQGEGERGDQGVEGGVSPSDLGTEYVCPPGCYQTEPEDAACSVADYRSGCDTNSCGVADFWSGCDTNGRIVADGQAAGGSDSDRCGVLQSCYARHSGMECTEGSAAVHSGIEYTSAAPNSGAADDDGSLLDHSDSSDEELTNSCPPSVGCAFRPAHPSSHPFPPDSPEAPGPTSLPPQRQGELSTNTRRRLRGRFADGNNEPTESTETCRDEESGVGESAGGVAGGEAGGDEGWRGRVGRLLAVPGTGWMLGLLFIYKLGETGALAMLPMFFLDNHISSADVTFWTGLVGQGVSVLGSLIGGCILSSLTRVPLQFLLQQLSLVRLLPLGAQLLVVVLWMSGSSTDRPASTLSPLPPGGAALSPALVDFLFGAAVASMLLLLLLGGVMTTVVFTLMMHCSRGATFDLQATHYTLLATAEVLGKLVFASLCGALADLLGYPLLFLIFAALSGASHLWLRVWPPLLAPPPLPRPHSSPGEDGGLSEPLTGGLKVD